MHSAAASAKEVSEVALTARAREELIFKHWPQVKGIAARMYHGKLPFQFNDLVQSGLIGLISAIDNFDNQMGVELKNYAEYRIRGSILDAFREIDYMSRSQRGFHNRLKEAQRTLESGLGRTPTQNELADYLGIPLEKFFEKNEPSCIMTSLESISDEGVVLPDAFCDDAPSIDEVCIENERNEILLEVLDRFPPRLRAIVYQRYWEELPIKEIAKSHGLGENRVNQLLAMARKMIFEALRARGVA